MKPVQIDFVAPRAWKCIWAIAAVVVLAIAVTSGFNVWQLRQQRLLLAQQLATLQAQQLQRLKQAKMADLPQDNLRAASEAVAKNLLQRDWNQLYDAIETPALTKVRLMQLSFDAVTGQVMLEYELDSMAQAVEVTQALSASTESQPVWKLERLDSGASPVATVGSLKIKGVWRATLN